MDKKIKIVVFAGSSRTGSFNKLFAKEAADLATHHGADVTFIDFKDFVLPVYDADLHKEDMPEKAKELKKLFLQMDAFIISTPEYNGAVPGILKNFLDWISVKENDADKRLEFIDKPALILSASPGALGGIRALNFLRILLSHLKVLVIPDQLALMDAGKAFDEHGKLLDVKKKEQLESYVKKLIHITQKLKN